MDDARAQAVNVGICFLQRRPTGHHCYRRRHHTDLGSAKWRIARRVIRPGGTREEK